jgi:hypothetical protein
LPIRRTLGRLIRDVEKRCDVVCSFWQSKFSLRYSASRVASTFGIGVIIGS